MTNKIGLFVVTYNRLDYLKQCIESLDKNNWGGATVRGIVDDCSEGMDYANYLQMLAIQGVKIIRKPENKGVANSKNQALKEMMYSECDHLFIMEDDILMKDPKTCFKYIGVALVNEIQHMNFAHHGVMNQQGSVEVGSVTCYPNCVGAFSYYTRQVIEEIGYMDEEFVNAWEHVEHTYRIVQKGLTSPFWFFADHPDSKDLLEEIPGSIDESSIRPRDDWQENITKGKEYWIKKHGDFLPPRPKM